MAFDLIARIRLVDKITAPLRRINEQMSRTQSTINRVEKVTKAYTEANDKLSDSVEKVEKESKKAEKSLDGVSRITRRLIGGVTAAGVAFGAYKLTMGTVRTAIDAARFSLDTFLSSVNAAAQREMEIVSIRGLMRDQKKAEQFFDYLEKRAAESMFSEQEFLTVGKTFIPVTRDIASLRRLIGLTERLAASNPMQGLEGAGFALRELLSGDATSIVERFNLPRKILNDIKKLRFEEQLVALDKLLNKIGFSEEFLKQIDDTGLAQWTQAVDKARLAWAKMGTAALDAIKPALKEINQLIDSPTAEKFVQFGSELFEGIGKRMTSAFRRAKEYAERQFFNNPVFQDLDVFAKVQFIISNLTDEVERWLNAGGREQLQEATKWLTDELTGMLKAAAPDIAAVATEVGKEIGKALIAGLWEGLQPQPEEHPLTKFQRRLEDAKKQGIDTTKVPVYGEGGTITAYEPTFGDKVLGFFRRLAPGHYHGIDYVPRDNYVARLHRGETVLNRNEAEEYRRGRGGGSVQIGQITINAAGGDLRDPSTVRYVVREIVRELSEQY